MRLALLLSFALLAGCPRSQPPGAVDPAPTNANVAAPQADAVGEAPGSRPARWGEFVPLGRRPSSDLFENPLTYTECKLYVDWSPATEQMLLTGESDLRLELRLPKAMAYDDHTNWREIEDLAQKHRVELASWKRTHAHDAINLFYRPALTTDSEAPWGVELLVGLLFEDMDLHPNSDLSFLDSFRVWGG